VPTPKPSELDAAALVIPIVGFDTGPRAVSTVDVIASRLTHSNGLVYRYGAESNVDGMAQPEGVFLLCTFWLARAYAATGRPALARKSFERALAWANDLGLLAEQIDPATGEALGNFPQAFSHIGLINAAYAIAVAEGTAKITVTS
jgi:GH15 family glucan-1,4-alpha-glucosidase